MTLAETPTTPVKPTTSPYKRHRNEQSNGNGKQQSKKASFGRETNTLLSSGKKILSISEYQTGADPNTGLTQMIETCLIVKWS